MIKFFVLIVIGTLSIIDIDGARILGVYPSPSISHQVVFRALTLGLVERGHEVVVITTDPAFPKGDGPANLTEIDLHDISYNYCRDFVSKFVANNEVGKISDYTSQLTDIQLFMNIIEIQIKSEAVQGLINERKEFDLVLIEAYMRPAIVYSHIFKAPVIQVSSCGAMLENLETVGASTHPFLYPTLHRQRLYNLSLWDKIREYYYYVKHMYYLEVNLRAENDMLQRIFGPSVPSISELNKNIDMLFLNVHPIWMDNQPVPPSVVLMGGLHQKPKKELPEDLKTYLDSSKNGVIYVSFGTNVHPIMFPPERLKLLTETLSELPYDVLFKWNDDELSGRTEYIRISKWLPQSDILRHPKVKAFIMQGGMQSTDEAITAGVPLICIPMIGDQWYNAEKHVKLKIGIQLDFTTLTKAQLKNAIETIISNKSYRENIVRLREQMYDQPQTPLERAVWWIEHVLRHGGAKHLRAPAVNMSWAEYYELKLVLIVLTGLLSTVAVFSYVIIKFCRVFIRFLYKRNNKTKTS